MEIDVCQYAYIWYDREINACKIGKTDDAKRLFLRMIEAISSNPNIEFVGAWRTNIGKDKIKDPKTGVMKKPDAGIIASARYTKLQFKKGRGGAKEWNNVSPEEAAAHLTSLFGEPEFTNLPQEVLNKGPYDYLGSTPKKGNTRVSRLWIHQEIRERGLLKLSDNSWWKTSKKSTWFQTFNPYDLKPIAVFEIPGISNMQSQWTTVSENMRNLKYQLHDSHGIKGLLGPAKCGWFDIPIEKLKQLLRDAGLVEISMDGPTPAGVGGQGENKGS